MIETLECRQLLSVDLTTATVVAEPGSDQSPTNSVDADATKSLAGVGAMLEALAGAEPPAPFLSHYQPSGERGPVERGATADAPWVGKRKRRR